MSDTVTQNGARILPYSSAAFVKIAVSNAIWLTGEWLAQDGPTPEQFAPQTRCIFEPRCREEALALLNNLSEALRHEVFCRSFMRRPCGGEHLFQTLRSHYGEMLDEAFRVEWERIVERTRLITTVHLAPTCTARKLLPKLTGPR